MNDQNAAGKHASWTVGFSAGVIAALAGAAPALAQSSQQDKDAKTQQATPIQPIQRAKPFRRSVIDLDRLAKERRPGQVMPGDPPVRNALVPAGAPAPAVTPDLLAPIPRQPAPTQPIDLPNTNAAKPVIIAPGREPETAPAAAVPAPAATPSPVQDAQPMPTSPATNAPAAPAPLAEAPQPVTTAAPVVDASISTQPGVVVSPAFPAGSEPPHVAMAKPVAPAPAVTAQSMRDREEGTPARIDQDDKAPAASMETKPAPMPGRSPVAVTTPRTIEAPAAQPTPAAPVHTAAPAPVVRETITPKPVEPKPSTPVVAATAPAIANRIEPTPRPPLPTDVSDAGDSSKAVVMAPTPAKINMPAPSTTDANVMVDERLATRMPAAASFSAATVVFKGTDAEASQMQWRTGTGAWSTPTPGQSVDGKIEIRAGIEADVRVIIDNTVELTIARLGRVIIERSAEIGGGAMPAVTLARGAVEVRPVKARAQDATDAYVRVRTPDQTFGVRGPMRVEYDAFSGTRRLAINPKTQD
jgi:hypothetical protein